MATVSNVSASLADIKALFDPAIKEFYDLGADAKTIIAARDSLLDSVNTLKSQNKIDMDALTKSVNTQVSAAKTAADNAATQAAEVKTTADKVVTDLATEVTARKATDTGLAAVKTTADGAKSTNTTQDTNITKLRTDVDALIGNLTADVTLVTGWEYYSSTNDTKLIKNGKVVTSFAVLKPSADMADVSEQLVATIPTGFRPIYDFAVIEQSSGQDRFLATFKANGQITVDRLGNSATEINFKKGNWVHLQATWVTT
jgi:hypothetical protein